MGKTVETKRERFVRVAEARTTKVISMLRLLGNCSNQSAYEYGKTDVAKIFNAIESALSDAKRRFKSSRGQSTEVFSLS